MLLGKKTLHWGVIALVILAAIVLIGTPLAQAQYWQALPPYNLLWPLWSPALSPVDPLTGLATPLVATLSNATILPTQPALAWDPAQKFPWLLYNIPALLGGGLTYFDPFYGLNPFPAPYLLDPVGLPLPITLPLGFGALPPTDITDFAPYVSLGNLYYNTVYPNTLSSLLTAAQIWGLPVSGLPLL